MKKLLTTLSILTLVTIAGSLNDVFALISQKSNTKIRINDTKTQQVTIYIDKNGKQKTTDKKDLSNINTTEIIQIGFYKNEIGEIQVVKMPKTIKKVPNQLPSEITSLTSMFKDTILFNQDISSWDTSNLVNMQSMFAGAIVFNQDLSKWNTSKVTNMSDMFFVNDFFNQDLSKWDVSNVTNMAQMFSNARGFNQDLSKWDTLKVTNMQEMFRYASAFKNLFKIF